ncbi:MAG TPA: oxidoreductase, partial [Mycobacterium sp.]
MSPDPLAPLMALPGVADASDQAREALGRAHRHRANLRRWPVTAAEAALRAARASAVLDGGGLKLDEQLDVSATSDPV